MSGSFDLVINGKTVKANYGETLVDAGLSGWVAIPHDCCSGQCETCRVSVVSGQVDDGGTAEKGTVLACQAKVIGNAAIAFDHVPEVAKRAGLVTGISVLTSEKKLTSPMTTAITGSFVFSLVKICSSLPSNLHFLRDFRG